MAHPNEDLVREGYAAFGRGDLDMLSNRFFADGVRWHFPGRSPFGGDYTGTGEVMTWLGPELRGLGRHDPHRVARRHRE